MPSKQHAMMIRDYNLCLHQGIFIKTSLKLDSISQFRFDAKSDSISNEDMITKADSNAQQE